jgi:hypothetical protein
MRLATINLIFPPTGSTRCVRETRVGQDRGAAHPHTTPKHKVRAELVVLLCYVPSTYQTSGGQATAEKVEAVCVRSAHVWCVMCAISFFCLAILSRTYVQACMY